MINKIILSAVLSCAVPVYADSAVDLVVPPAPTPVAAPVPAPLPVATPTPDAAAAAAAAAQQQQAAVNAAALQAMAAEQQAAMMNMMASAALFAACMASRPPAIPLCMMGALAAAQGGADSGYAGQSGNTANASNEGTSGVGGTSGTSANPALGDGGAGYDKAAIASGQTYLNNAGYSVSPSGVTAPDGTVTPASTFSSPATMAAAGIDSGTIAASQKALASVNQAGGANGSNLKVSSVGVSEGAGGPAGEGGNYDGSGSGRSRIYNPFALTAKDKQKLAAGKTVLFDGEPIGVKGQNIFDMVHVAYDRKRQHNHFIESDSGVVAPVTMRAPARHP